MTFEIEWYGDKILQDTNKVVAKASKTVAENLMEDAKKILKKNASTKSGKKKKAYGTSPGGLLDQFDIQPSRFKNGGLLVWCQGPKNWRPPYHASFLELGTYKDEAQPFMRPAAAKNRRRAPKVYQDSLDDWLANG